MWFNEEDDFEDVPADTKLAPDLDNSISELELKKYFAMKLLMKVFSMSKLETKIFNNFSHHFQVKSWTRNPKCQTGRNPIIRK